MTFKRIGLFLFSSLVDHLRRAIGGYFKEKGLRIGLCTEQEYFDKFNITRTPAVLYMNASGSYPVENVQITKFMKYLMQTI